jgi:hypothetical protein
MKRRISTLLIMVCMLNTSCIKSLLDKKKDDANEDPNKYAGVWKAAKIAVDQDGDNSLDENEKGDINGNSELRMNSNGTFTYSLVANGGGTPFNMSGNWKLSDDRKSVTITDNSQGSMRFDIKNDNEIITEPIPSNGKTAWIIYFR